MPNDTSYLTAATFPARDLDDPRGPIPWLSMIHAINSFAPGTFGEPTDTDSVALLGGGTRYSERYTDSGFVVEFVDSHPNEPLRSFVRIVALTQPAADLLADALEELS